uniref:Uncharacterized protein n=1 Tax=Arundo donax TaxID=35708 RepID=A0A0A9D4F9_ARUDO
MQTAFVDNQRMIHIVHSSSAGLLLCSRGRANRVQYYVCNPVTWQCMALPDMPWAMASRKPFCSLISGYHRRWQHQALSDCPCQPSFALGKTWWVLGFEGALLGHRPVTANAAAATILTRGCTFTTFPRPKWHRILDRVPSQGQSHSI